LLYRLFACKKMVNRPMERALVKALSDQGMCPEVIYQSERVRIERFIEEARNISIKEMREELVVEEFAKVIARLHYNKKASDLLESFIPRSHL